MRTFQVMRAHHQDKNTLVSSTMRCYGSRPSQAALKASTKICSKNNIQTLTLTIQEITPNSKHKIFTYKCTRKKKKKPTTISNGVRFAYSMTCKSVPSPKSLYGGGKIGMNYSIVCHGCVQGRRASAISVPENMEIHFYTTFGKCLMVSSFSAAEICQNINEKGIMYTFYSGEVIPNFTLSAVGPPATAEMEVFTGSARVTRCLLPGGCVQEFDLFHGFSQTTTLQDVLNQIVQDFHLKAMYSNQYPKIHVHCLFCAVTCDNQKLPKWIEEIQGKRMQIDIDENAALQFTGQMNTFILL